MEISKLVDDIVSSDLGIKEDEPMDTLELDSAVRKGKRYVSKNPGKSLRVLLVDDDEIYHTLIKQVLRQADSGIQCLTAVDVLDATVMLADQSVDIVLLDYLLQDGVLGPEHIDEIREAAQDSHLPIVVLTGFGNEQKVVDAFREGASDYLSKNGLSAGALYRSLSNSVEAAKLRRQNDLNRQTILKANKLLKEQKKQIASFYQTVSHELKSPLMGAREYTALVRDGVVGEVSHQQAELLENAINCCDSLKTLIDDLVDTASIENGKLRMNLSHCNIAEIGRQCLNRYHWAAKQANVEFINEISETVPVILADSLRLEQLISNLLSNAFKYSRPHGNVVLKIEPDAQRKAVTITVTDTGVGIPEDCLSQIFDKFYQVENTEQQSSPGMGLGLFLAQKIVDLHQGHMAVRSKPGEGSVFTVSLPTEPVQAKGDDE